MMYVASKDDTLKSQRNAIAMNVEIFDGVKSESVDVWCCIYGAFKIGYLPSMMDIVIKK